MVFVVLSSKDKRFGHGQEIDKNTFQSPNGLNLYFYEESELENEFKAFNVQEIKEINEPEENPIEKHWMIVCKK